MYRDICILSYGCDVSSEDRQSIGECICECRTSSIVSTERDPSTRILIQGDPRIFWENPHDFHIVHDIETSNTLYYVSEIHSQITSDDEAFCSSEFMDIVRVGSQKSIWIPLITRCSLHDPISWGNPERMES